MAGGAGGSDPAQAMPDTVIGMVQSRFDALGPDAKRVLLTAYADTEAAIAAINDVALD